MHLTPSFHEFRSARSGATSSYPVTQMPSELGWNYPLLPLHKTPYAPFPFAPSLLSRAWSSPNPSRSRGRCWLSESLAAGTGAPPFGPFLLGDFDYDHQQPRLLSPATSRSSAVPVEVRPHRPFPQICIPEQIMMSSIVHFLSSSPLALISRPAERHLFFFCPDLFFLVRLDLFSSVE